MTAASLERFGEWAIVTGASSGIGREVALRLAASRVNVVLVARNEQSLTRLAAEIESRGSRAKVIPLDLAQPDAAKRLEQATIDLDTGILVNSAGFGSGGAFLESDPEEEIAMVDVNCRAVLDLTIRFARRFAARKRGAIVLLSSIVAFQGVARSANYAATKAYIQSLGEALAEEMKGTGVLVLRAIPGPAESGFAQRAGMKFGSADTAGAVADDIVAALARNRTSVIAGRLGKVLYYSLMTAPRFLRVSIIKRIMASMTRP